MVDVELGNDLGSLLPSELQALGTPELEEVALLRFAQRRMLQVRRESKERENRGPMVVLVDESGSMSGEREIWAKAVTLALLGIAEQERRDFALVGFNNSQRVLRWGNKPSKSDVLAWLASQATGGTSFRPALDAGMRLVEEAKAGSSHEGADLILITDADDNGSINADWREAWSERAEATGAHLYVVYVQSDMENIQPRGRRLRSTSERGGRRVRSRLTLWNLERLAQ